MLCSGFLAMTAWTAAMAVSVWTHYFFPFLGCGQIPAIIFKLFNFENHGFY
jgi:hypothetical protein